jgi:hypothetical protein
MHVPICVCISWAENSNLHKPEQPTIFWTKFWPIFGVNKSLFRKSTKILESHFLKHPVNFTISLSSKPQNTVKKLKRKSLRGECQFQSFKIQLLFQIWFDSIAKMEKVSFKTFYGKFKIILIIETHNFPSSFKMNFFSDKLPN